MIASVLATYRLSRAVMMEQGPFNAFILLRSYIYDNHDGTWLAEGLDCPLCVSFWVSLLVVLMPAKMREWLAVAGLFVLLYKKGDHDFFGP